MRKHPLSVSGLTDFEGCPKRYFHTRLAKTHKSQVTEAITHGNEVHKRLEMHVKKGEVLPEHLRHVEQILDYLKAEGYQLFAELEMAIDRNWQPVDYWSKDGWIWGKIDLIALRGTEAMVFDYKTGKRKTGKYADDTQLKLYGAVLFHVLGLSKVESGYLWLKTREADNFVIDGGNIAIIQQEIFERVTKLETAEKENDFPARTSPLCGWCPVLNDCEFASYYREKKKNAKR